MVRVEGPDGRVLWCGQVVFSWDPAHTNGVSVTGNTPLSLLEGIPLPFDPPGLDAGGDPAASAYWWRQLVYVFELDDPRCVPSLPEPLAPADATNAERFTQVTRRLATSSLLSSRSGVTVHRQHPESEPITMVDFPAFEVQAGFAVTLRQCDDPDESASFSNVKNVIALACKGSDDAGAAVRSATVEAWGRAVRRLHQRSLEQLVRDRLVAEEGWRGFDFQEGDSPRQLVKKFNYGEFIHWNAKSDVRPDTPEFLALWLQYEFLVAAAGLAHLYVGFGELVRALLNR
jgi:hypothetical protein